MIYCFDIDGTLCSNRDGAYERAKPRRDFIGQVNTLYDAGHRIILYTARGSATGIDWRALIESQLRSWGVKYHELSLGKPHGDIYVDDKAAGQAEWKMRLLATKESTPIAGPAIGGQSVLRESAYLNITYSAAREPYGDYPYLLGRWLLDHLFKSPGSLLDLGCGRGEHLAAFSQLSFDVAGVDISASAPEFARGYRVAVADLERDPLPFPPNSFDFVFSKSVVEHMRNPTCLLSKALEALRPGGTAVVMTPSWAHTYWGPFYIDHT
jgi:hypothetical protein